MHGYGGGAAGDYMQEQANLARARALEEARGIRLPSGLNAEEAEAWVRERYGDGVLAAWRELNGADAYPIPDEYRQPRAGRRFTRGGGNRAAHVDLPSRYESDRGRAGRQAGRAANRAESAAEREAERQSDAMYELAAIEARAELERQAKEFGNEAARLEAERKERRGAYNGRRVHLETAKAGTDPNSAEYVEILDAIEECNADFVAKDTELGSRIAEAEYRRDSLERQARRTNGKDPDFRSENKRVLEAGRDYVAELAAQGGGFGGGPSGGPAGGADMASAVDSMAAATVGNRLSGNKGLEDRATAGVAAARESREKKRGAAAGGASGGAAEGNAEAGAAAVAASTGGASTGEATARPIATGTAATQPSASGATEARPAATGTTEARPAEAAAAGGAEDGGAEAAEAGAAAQEESAVVGRSELENLQAAKDVIEGKYGNQPDRQPALEAAGYSYADVQGLVNQYANDPAALDDAIARAAAQQQPQRQPQAQQQPQPQAQAQQPQRERAGWVTVNGKQVYLKGEAYEAYIRKKEQERPHWAQTLGDAFGFYMASSRRNGVDPSGVSASNRRQAEISEQMAQNYQRAAQQNFQIANRNYVDEANRLAMAQAEQRNRQEVMNKGAASAGAAALARTSETADYDRQMARADEQRAQGVQNQAQEGTARGAAEQARLEAKKRDWQASDLYRENAEREWISRAPSNESTGEEEEEEQGEGEEKEEVPVEEEQVEEPVEEPVEDEPVDDEQVEEPVDNGQDEEQKQPPEPEPVVENTGPGPVEGGNKDSGSTPVGGIAGTLDSLPDRPSFGAEDVDAVSGAAPSSERAGVETYKGKDPKKAAGKKFYIYKGLYNTRNVFGRKKEDGRMNANAAAQGENDDGKWWQIEFSKDGYTATPLPKGKYVYFNDIYGLGFFDKEEFNKYRGR